MARNDTFTEFSNAQAQFGERGQTYIAVYTRLKPYLGVNLRFGNLRHARVYTGIGVIESSDSYPALRHTRVYAGIGGFLRLAPRRHSVTDRVFRVDARAQPVLACNCFLTYRPKRIQSSVLTIALVRQAHKVLTLRRSGAELPPIKRPGHTNQHWTSVVQGARPPLQKGEIPVADRLAYSVNTLSEVTDISKSQIKKAIYNGELPARKNGIAWLILADDAHAYLEGLPRPRVRKAQRQVETLEATA